MAILSHRHALRPSRLVRPAALAVGLWLLQAPPASSAETAFESSRSDPTPSLDVNGYGDPGPFGRLPLLEALRGASPREALGEPPLPSADSVDLFAASADAPSAEPGDPPAFDTSYETAEPCLLCASYWGLLKRDVKHVFTAPVRWDSATWRSVGLKSLLVVGAMAFLDGRSNDYVDNHRSDDSVRNANNFGPFGEQYAAYVIGGFLLAGKLGHNEKAKAVAVDSFTTTLIAAGLIVPALKEITGRSRPREDQGPHDFHPFSGGYSFPSGHSAAAFSVAASVAEHYDRIWIKSLSYGIASLVDYSRMEKDAHFLSDVAAGAMIGVGVAHSIHEFNEGKRASLAVLPTSDPNGRGLDGLEVAFEIGLR